ncbi:hypothetical protein [Natrinema sp. 1APR25-10V2]|uniref:hypothetical protein n=1 Tax=Natrinema sp. 1APR25-10V2 TaxID=2951081 RepID=UPI0028767F72|nr:hypothetical protein [Natrinema sp. 1APR25-10V2]MDS0477914.1 hypothetical protein [Natrinema sp. 1APR25-10V2]
MEPESTVELNREQLSLLYAAREISKRDGEPAVVDRHVVDDVRELLGDVIGETTGLSDPMALDLEQMIRQIDADRDDAVDQLADANQMPETGGVEPDPDPQGDEPADDPIATVGDAFGAADADAQQEAMLLLAKAETLERNDRLPEHSPELRAEAAEIIDVSVDDLESAIDADEIDVPSSPKLALQ